MSRHGSILADINHAHADDVTLGELECQRAHPICSTLRCADCDVDFNCGPQQMRHVVAVGHYGSLAHNLFTH